MLADARALERLEKLDKHQLQKSVISNFHSVASLELIKQSQKCTSVIRYTADSHHSSPLLINLIAGAMAEVGVNTSQGLMHNFKTDYLSNTSVDAQPLAEIRAMEVIGNANLELVGNPGTAPQVGANGVDSSKIHQLDSYMTREERKRRFV
ncbi:hypothetical protein B0O99DRAFT_679193 [Bisporella sp. PMI_857]|nr:hypothetical protein B0O99DRAFT_679193 [Bisporella sp. PMI_857]